jgi:hypothetical protein
VKGHQRLRGVLGVQQPVLLQGVHGTPEVAAVIVRLRGWDTRGSSIQTSSESRTHGFESRKAATRNNSQSPVTRAQTHLCEKEDILGLALRQRYQLVRVERRRHVQSLAGP